MRASGNWEARRKCSGQLAPRRRVGSGGPAARSAAGEIKCAVAAPPASAAVAEAREAACQEGPGDEAAPATARQADNRWRTFSQRSAAGVAPAGNAAGLASQGRGHDGRV